MYIVIVVFVWSMSENHDCNLYVLLCELFYRFLVDVARYAALIQTKSPINCDIYLAESIFKTHSSGYKVRIGELKFDGR